MNETKQMNKLDYGNAPNRILYFMVAKLSYIFLKIKYRIKIDNSSLKNMKAPYIVLANHPSALDPFILTATMYPHKVNILGTNHYFRIPILRPLLKLAGIVPKVQAYKDTRAVRMMNKVIAIGGILVIYPEGRRSTDGSQYTISDSIAKLIKLYKVPVAAVVSNGAYLSKPRWTSFPHRGCIEVNTKEVLSAEQIKELSIEKIHSAVCSSIYYNDYQWNRIKKVSFKHKKIAENIHNILHQCPGCGKEKAMRSNKNRLYCKFCGNAALMDEYGFLNPEAESSVIFEDAVKWLKWQREKAKATVQAIDFSIVSKVVKLTRADAFTGPYRNAGHGTAALTNEGLTFNGIVDSKPQEMFFPMSVMYSISSEFGSNFEITDGKNTYCFFLEDGQDVARIELAVHTNNIE
ncbi:1-acyl-sn-glycerol-3-phosphate acyltransferase [Clostridium swellfunianum]|uniref:lysophospholipid acyltransferase family protein n=1 Tax=Clostridium swellfunianum TaxID=1367462 RepID=UPI00202F4084|nr:lysophospholipid acyltransferase family protein [Clostridium swellfunianum]MCM0647520.1 1-acyl-sn-glycerol-3-phosphate acyltransferase [Clostridium swellfunianum]